MVMKKRTDAASPPPPAGRTRYNKYGFEAVKSGYSIWVETERERRNVVAAFNRWKARHGSPLRATAQKVGDLDPDGTGHRIWFVTGDV